MARGRLESPNLDDRKWQDIVDQAKALIPKYAPEWTDHNPSDLGIALIELFAWLVEGLTYRLNRVPDKMYTEFLNLLGITRDPATPASTYLTYRLAPGTTAPVTIGKGSQAATPQTETEEAIVFETDEDLKVLPINLTTALYQFIDGTAWKYKNVTNKLISSPLSGMNIDLEEDIPSKHPKGIILLGFDEASTEPIALNFRFSKPSPKNDLWIYGYYSTGDPVGLSIFTISKPPPGSSIPDSPIIVSDGTKGFQQNGVLSITLPGTLLKPWISQIPEPWASISPASTVDKVNQSLFWLAIVVSNMSKTQPIKLGLEHILFNSVPATNALTIPQPELLGTSNGQPFQFFELQNAPLFKRPMAENPYDHLVLQVREPKTGDEFSDWKIWIPQDDFPTKTESDPNENCYFRLDPVTGTVIFGNYDPQSSDSSKGRGKIPPRGSEIRAFTYRYVVGGSKGNVLPNTVNVIRKVILPKGMSALQPGLVSVINPGSVSEKGADEEPIERTKQRAPELLRNRNRAITVEDYEYLAREPRTDIAIVRCLSPQLHEDNRNGAWKVGDPWRFGEIDRSPGNVNVIIVPDYGLNNPRPEPTQKLIQEIQCYLDQRRDLTANLKVTGPRYLPIKVDVIVSVWSKAITNGLLAKRDDIVPEIMEKIRRFLHPVHGGPKGTGWKVGQHVYMADLYKAIMPSEEIGFISSVTVAAETPLYHSSNSSWDPNERPFPLAESGVSVLLADYELVCYGDLCKVTSQEVEGG
jgi:Baseplate J-like protein